MKIVTDFISSHLYKFKDLFEVLIIDILKKYLVNQTSKVFTRM